MCIGTMNGHRKQREESRRMIETAMFELMREMEFSRITVTQIAQRADVARRTFYRLYQNKEDVIRRYFDKLCREYQSCCGVLDSYDIRKISAEYFSFWYRHRDILLLLDKCGLDSMLYYEMSRASAEVVGSRMSGEAQCESSGYHYFADYSAGGFINLLRRWIKSGMKEEPQEYAEKVSEAILKVVYDEKL